VVGGGARLRKGTRKKITVKREAKGDASVLPECQQGHGGKHLGGLDGFRVRGRCGVRVQRSHRRTR